MSEYTIKDSGDRQQFDTGAKRDTEEGKPRYDLIPTFALRRVANHYAGGAIKYGPNNWQKGMPYSRCLSSAERHLHEWKQGNREEDHLAALCFNVLAIMHFEETDRRELDDLFDYGEPQYVEDWELDADYDAKVRKSLEELGYKGPAQDIQLRLEGLDGGISNRNEGCDCDGDCRG